MSAIYNKLKQHYKNRMGETSSTAMWNTQTETCCWESAPTTESWRGLGLCPKMKTLKLNKGGDKKKKKKPKSSLSVHINSCTLTLMKSSWVAQWIDMSMLWLWEERGRAEMSQHPSLIPVNIYTNTGVRAPERVLSRAREPRMLVFLCERVCSRDTLHFPLCLASVCVLPAK